MESATLVFDARIQCPMTMIISGPPLAGKTWFAIRLLEESHRLMNPPPQNIVWFYGEQTGDLRRIRERGIQTIAGLPEDGFEEYIVGETNLFIFDDMMTEISSDKSLTHLVTRASHHRNISVIFLTQDHFYNGSERKTFSRSAHYLVLFRNPLDLSSIYALANKIAPKNVKSFLRIFQTATNKPNGYLFVDGRQSTPSDAKFRTDIFGPYQRNFALSSS